MNQPRPRRIPRTIRYGIAAILALVVVPLLRILVGQSGDGGAGPMLAIGAMSAVIVAIALIVGNVGLGPRVSGQYLDVITVLGRQSLDLDALTGVRWGRTRSGTITLRLRDQITDVEIPMAYGPAVHTAIRDGLVAAAQRGVVLPRRVTNHFNLPPVPGAPRNGSSMLPMVLGFLAGSACLGLIAGLLLSR